MSKLTTFTVTCEYQGNPINKFTRLIDAQTAYDAHKRASQYADCHLVLDVTIAPKNKQGKGDKPMLGDHDYVEPPISRGCIVLCMVALWVLIVVVISKIIH